MLGMTSMNDYRYPRRGKLLYLGLLVLTALLAVAPRARACQTPVFRYALEKWPGDDYLLMIYHDKPLSPDDKAIADWLGKFEDTEGSQISLYMMDTSKPVTTQPAAAPSATQPTTQGELSRDDAQRAYLLKKFPPPTDIPMPAMVLRYPARSGPEELPIWPVVHSGPLDGKIARAIIDSPARQKIAKRLLSGDSSVWVMLESGDKAKDDAAAMTLETELARMKKELKLPQQPARPDDDFDAPKIAVELKLAFSVLRVSRTDPAERMFIKMLLGIEEGLTKYKEPMAFPIFGRGRALTAFVGAGIEADNILEACEFLVDRCSCQVKRLNPGTDIMFSVNWDAALAGQPMMTMPPLPRLATDEVEVKSVSLAAGQGQDVAAEDAPSHWLLIIAIALVAVAVVVGVPMVRVMRKGAGH